MSYITGLSVGRNVGCYPEATSNELQKQHNHRIMIEAGYTFDGSKYTRPLPTVKNGYTAKYFGTPCKIIFVSDKAFYYKQYGLIPKGQALVEFNSDSGFKEKGLAKLEYLTNIKTENNGRKIEIQRFDCKVKRPIRRKANPIKSKEGKAKCKRSNN